MSDNLPWKTWTPDDLAPPQAEFVPQMEPEETVTEEAEPSLEQQLAQLQMQAHEQGYQAGIAEGRQQGHEQGYQDGLAQGLEQGLEQAKSQQAPIHARMQQLVSEFQTTLDALDSVIASRLMQMALEKGAQPLREFMLRQTREADLALFARLANSGPLQGPEAVPMRILLPAYVTSELKTAFQIGFTIFIPFLIIDLVIASVLMALGMMMVPPATIALPFKLMLFVLVDGWQLLVGSLAQSFYS